MVIGALLIAVASIPFLAAIITIGYGIKWTVKAKPWEHDDFTAPEPQDTDFIG